MERASSMKLLRLVIIAGLMLIASACSFNAKVITPEPISVTELPAVIEPSVVAIVDSPISSETPVSTVDLTPAATVVYPPVNSAATPIQFAPNGTYLDLVDSISAGMSKTYSVLALQGQVMSVSIKQSNHENWATVPMQITGENGTELCPPKENVECYFWRGALPTTQNYFITLTPFIDISNFTLRVAIDPPGSQTQTFSYTSQNGQVSFSYTDEFAPVRFPESYLYKFTPELALQFIDTNSLVGTNLVEAYYFFGASNDPLHVNDCLQPPDTVENETDKGNVMINGITFAESQRGGAAAGNLYEQTYFRTVSQGTCYDITFFVHYADMGVYVPNLIVKEFDREALLQKFRAILSTLVIK